MLYSTIQNKGLSPLPGADKYIKLSIIEDILSTEIFLYININTRSVLGSELLNQSAKSMLFITSHGFFVYFIAATALSIFNGNRY